MMNQNNTAAAIAAINEILTTVTTTATTAIKAIEAIISATETATTTATETTTTEATTTEATTTPEEKAMNNPKAIVVLDEDDNVIAVGATTGTEATAETTTTGNLPCPTADTTAPVETATTTTTAETTETATAPVETATTTTTAETTETATAPVETATTTTTAEAVTETTVNGVTTSRKSVVATATDLENIYNITKYILRHEGVNTGVDKSIYAPAKNIYVSFYNNKYRMNLSMYDTELMIALTKCEKDENIIMKIMMNLSSIEVTTVDDEIEIAGNNARINTVINMMSSAIDLIK